MRTVRSKFNACPERMRRIQIPRRLGTSFQLSHRSLSPLTMRGYLLLETEDFRRRISPILIVSPSRSKYSKSGIVYLRLEPIRSRNDPAVISPLSERNFLRTALI